MEERERKFPPLTNTINGDLNEKERERENKKEREKKSRERGSTFSLDFQGIGLTVLGGARREVHPHDKGFS